MRLRCIELFGASVPMLSDRHNIVVIADEAHRSQYDLIDGLARNMRDALPNASFIRFTGTPIETHDANTRAVFGDYVSNVAPGSSRFVSTTGPADLPSELTVTSVEPRQVPNTLERLSPNELSP